MSGLARRYELVPQLRDYERLPSEWVPYLMRRTRGGVRSACCNTDAHGFRLTRTVEGRLIDYDQFRELPAPKGLLVGGSLAFGVGASSDSTTLASLLNQLTPLTWCNFGCRTFNATQEALLGLLYRSDAQEIALVSGLNNLITHPLSGYFVPGLGSFCEDYRFHQGMRLQERPLSIFAMSGQWLRRRMDHLVPRTPDALDNPDSYQRLLEVVARDMDLWCLIRDSRHCRVSYFLQPCALWVRKTLSPEEAELFAILDRAGGRPWKALMHFLRNCYPRYRDDLRSLCEERDIPFEDLNAACPMQGWLFCDRAHLTDEGSRIFASRIAARFVQPSPEPDGRAAAATELAR